MTFRYCIILSIAIGLAACSQNSRRSEWDSIDYTRVYERQRSRENDSSYRQPTVVGCMDDDLFNCR
jgi:hypothetical protein